MVGRRIPLPLFPLYWAGVPAVGTGICLLPITQVPRSTQALQVVSFILASLAFFALVPGRRMEQQFNTEWLTLALALSLLVPLRTLSSGLQGLGSQNSDEPEFKPQPRVPGET